MKVTAQLYGQFLLLGQVSATGTHLAEHLAGLQPDNVPCALPTTRLTPRRRWQQVRGEFGGSARSYVLFDDTVLDSKCLYCPLKSNHLIDDSGGQQP